MNIKIHNKTDRCKIKARVCFITIMTVLLVFLLPFIQYHLYISKCKKEVKEYKEEIIQYQYLLPNNPIKIYERIDGIKIQSVSVVCTSKNNVFYRVVPTSKLLIERSSANCSQEIIYYEELYSAYILKSNHIENMDFKSYLAFIDKDIEH